jgi:hypothetical protein
MCLDAVWLGDLRYRAIELPNQSSAGYDWLWIKLKGTYLWGYLHLAALGQMINTARPLICSQSRAFAGWTLRSRSTD